jgi:hypothetical protein
MLDVPDLHRCADLLSFSVENKLLPRIEFLESLGLSSRAARSMACHFLTLFAYVVDGNMRPKADYLLGTIWRQAGHSHGKGLEEQHNHGRPWELHHVILTIVVIFKLSIGPGSSHSPSMPTTCSIKVLKGINLPLKERGDCMQTRTDNQTH